MYKLRTKDGVYFFQSLENVFWFIDAYEQTLLASDDDFVKLYFIDEKGNEKK